MLHIFTTCHLDQSRYDHLHRLVDDSEAVSVVQAHDVGSHEGEDGHDVVQHLLLQDEQETGRVTEETQTAKCFVSDVKPHSQGRWRRRCPAAAERGGESAACRTL